MCAELLKGHAWFPQECAGVAEASLHALPQVLPGLRSQHMQSIRSAESMEFMHHWNSDVVNSVQLSLV